MRKLTRGLFLASTVLIASLSTLQMIASAQGEHRVVHIQYPNDCPIKIGALKVAEEPIEPTKTFPAGEDWLKSLSWEIENTWEKPVEYVEIDLDFHGLATREDSVFKYQYGRRTNRPGDLAERKLLRLGERTRVIISDEEYARIKRFIEMRQANFRTFVVEMKVAKVVFEDATVWLPS